jgi:aromatase
MAAHTDNSIEIAAPLELVWNSMMDIEDWPNLFSEYAKAEIIEREGENTVRFRLTTHPDPEYNDQVWSWVSERIADPATHSSKSRRIETGPFEYMNIEWFFEGAGDGTLMRWVQDFTMKPSAPATDDVVEANMNKNTKIQMALIKEKLEARAAAGAGS